MRAPKAYLVFDGHDDALIGFVHGQCAEIHPTAVIQDDGEAIDRYGNDIVPLASLVRVPAHTACMDCDGIIKG